MSSVEDFLQGNALPLARSLIISLAINWGLQGMLCLQVYTYYLAFPRDLLQAKLQVYGVFIFEFIQTAVVTYDVVMACGSPIRDFNSLNSLHTTWFTIPLAGGITGGVGQLFFAYRIWMISSEIKPTLTIAFISIASICSALISAGAFFHAKIFSTLLNSNATEAFAPITAWNGIGAICDISITLSMPYFLMRHGTGLPSTHVVIVRLVRLLIETGGLTSIIAILHLCLYVSHSPLFVIPGLTISKIYATTMLVMLNNRIKISGGRLDQEDEEEECSLSPLRERRNSRTTKILVSNGRLTFQLADVPHLPRPSDNNTDNGSVMGVNTSKVELDQP